MAPLNLRSIIKSKPPLRGGIIGIIVCLILFLFNLYVYFPLVTDAEGVISSWALVPPLITGQLFPMFSIFIVPYGLFCEFTEPTCVRWSAGYSYPDCIPWEMEGVQGCCQEQVMQPTAVCDKLSDQIGFIGLSVLLFLGYFLVGALIGKYVWKRKSR